MSLITHEGRAQICCDSCPASLPAEPREAFAGMVERAKREGWRITKTKPAPERDTATLFGALPKIAGDKKPEPYTHTCPACAKPRAEDRRLF